MLSLKDVVAANNKQVAVDLQGEVVVLNTDSGIYYSMDNATWSKYNGTPVLLNSTDNHTVYYYSRDLLNNTEVIGNIMVRVDMDPPQATAIMILGALGDNGWYVSDVMFEISATDVGSGVWFMQWSWDGATYFEYNASEKPNRTADGEYIIYYRAADLAGHLDSKDNSAAGKDEPKLDESLETSDYQLFQALNLLKGMHIMQAQKAKKKAVE